LFDAFLARYALHKVAFEKGEPLDSDQLSRLRLEMQELGEYLVDAKLMQAPNPGSSLGRLVRFAAATGLPDASLADVVCRLVQTTGRRSRGRPGSARALAVIALEMRVTRELSWQQLTDSLCGCGAKKQAHPQKCEDRIRSAVKQLERLMKQYQIVLPSPWGGGN
jgi:hypothetical protein